MLDYIDSVIKDALCASLKSLKYPDVNFRVSISIGFYSLYFWHAPTHFSYYDIYTFADIEVIGDKRLYEIVSDMYKALEKHAKSDGKNAASYFIDENPRNDPLDTARYFYETTQYFKKSKEKENNKMENRITSTANTEAEINYNNAISEIDQHQAEDYDKIRKKADAARLAAKQELEIQTLREEKRRIALDYRFFYEELIAAGFSEEEAWKILLNKQPGYMAPTCYAFSDI